MSFKLLLRCAVQKFDFGRAIFWGGGGAGFAPPQEPPNLVQTIVSQTTSYIKSFNFLCSAIQKFHFAEAFWG